MILITGANGFIGRNLLKQFLELGYQDNLRVFIRKPVPEFEQKKVKCCYGDMINQQELIGAFDGVSVVIHLASKNIDTDKTGFYSTNVDGAKNLAEACAEKKIKKLIYLSSTGVYGHHCDLSGIKEDYPIHPDTGLSQSKAQAEEIFLRYHKEGAFQVLILRPRFIYGPYDTYFIPPLIHYMKKSPFLINGGRAKVSLIHVRDLSNLIYKLAINDMLIQDDHPVFHVNDGHPITYKEIIDVLSKKFGYDKVKKSVPFWLIHSLVRVRELLFNNSMDNSSSINSLKIKLLTYDNYFLINKINKLFPEQKLLSFDKNFRKEDYDEKI